MRKQRPPEDYVMVDGNYYRKKGGTSDVPNVENLYLIQKGFSPKENGMINGIQVFLKPDGNNIIEATMDVMLDKINAPKDTKVEKYKEDDKAVYYVENIDEFHAEDERTATYFYLYGLIADNKSKQALYFELENACLYIYTKHCTV